MAGTGTTELFRPATGRGRTDRPAGRLEPQPRQRGADGPLPHRREEHPGALQADQARAGHAPYAGHGRERRRPLRARRARTLALGERDPPGAGRGPHGADRRARRGRAGIRALPAALQRRADARDRRTQGGGLRGPRPAAQAHRLLRDLHHARRLRQPTGHGPHGDPRPAVRPAGREPRLLRQRPDGRLRGRVPRASGRRRLRHRLPAEHGAGTGDGTLHPPRAPAPRRPPGHADRAGGGPAQHERMDPTHASRFP